ncbi:hypothetical protein [Allorhodopirellula solitaria]|uniref:hypothetical protein n=1 Tax=Allorhodopirellula solitaria TaxID=2527987 RepID=UPI0011B572B1|nr:hypothetical protein [Allorhodopirellula solitaria]
MLNRRVIDRVSQGLRAVLKHSSLAALSFAFSALAVTAVAVFRYGSISQAIENVRGPAVRVSDSSIELGRLTVGRHRANVTIANSTAEQIQVVGGRGSCQCLSFPKLPVSVPPGERTAVQLLVTTYPSGEGQSHEHEFVLFTNHVGSERIGGDVRWRQ